MQAGGMMGAEPRPLSLLDPHPVPRVRDDGPIRHTTQKSVAPAPRPGDGLHAHLACSREPDEGPAPQSGYAASRDSLIVSRWIRSR